MITIRCFGEVAAVDPEGVRLPLQSRKHLAVLLFLVAHPRTVHTRDKLGWMLWENGVNTRHSVSQALYDIRSAVGPVVEVGQNSIRLRRGRLVYEADLLERAVNEGDYKTSLEIYRGAFAPELSDLDSESFERWLTRERERCRVLASVALRETLAMAEKLGRWDMACLTALRLIQENEFDDEAHRALIRALWMKGDVRSAQTHLRILRRDGRAPADLEQLLQRPPPEQELVAAENGAFALGRWNEFRQMMDVRLRPGSAPFRVAIAGERGTGRLEVLREFARFMSSEGSRVCWLTDSAWSFGGVSPRPLSSRLHEIGEGPCLVVFRAGPDEWTAVDRAVKNGKLHGALVVGLSCPDIAQGELVAGRVDLVLPFEPLAQEDIADLLRGDVPNWSSRHADASAALAGGNVSLARAIARTWARLGHEPDDVGFENEDCRVAYEGSEEVRALVNRQMDVLSEDERHLVARISNLTPYAREHAVEVVAEPSLEGALGQLTTRGWVKIDERRLHVARPMAGKVLSWSLPVSQRSEYHREAAKRLAGGSQRARAAAVWELAAAGEVDRAYEVGLAVVEEALLEGVSPEACRAGGLALCHAPTDAERVKVGFAVADAEMQLGRFQRASGTLHQFATVVREGDETARVHLGFARIAVAEENEGAMQTHWHRLGDIRHQTTDPYLNRAIRAQRSVLQALSRPGDQTREANLLELGRAMETMRAGDEGYAGTWCDVFRLMLIRQTDIDTYRHFLTQHRFRLCRLGPDGVNLVTAADCSIGLRQGRPRIARDLLEGTSKPRRGSRYEAIRLNNMGVVALELGELARAEKMFHRARGLQERLGTPWRDHVARCFNQAQCAWFSGNFPLAREFAREVRALPRLAAGRGLNSQARAIEGLIALESGRKNEAKGILEVLDGEPSMQSPDNGYFVHWFRAALQPVGGRDAAAEALMDASNELARYDQLAASKLAVIARALQPKGRRPEYADAYSRLRGAGCAWFARFIDAWIRSRG